MTALAIMADGSKRYCNTRIHYIFKGCRVFTQYAYCSPGVNNSFLWHDIRYRTVWEYNIGKHTYVGVESY